MAEEAFVLRGIDWRKTFPFTNLFRAFRVAIYPSKLALALLCLLLVYGWGRVLDGIWPDSYSQQRGQIAFITPFSGSSLSSRGFGTFTPDNFGSRIRPDVLDLQANPKADNVGPFVWLMDAEGTRINHVMLSVLNWNWPGMLWGVGDAVIWIPVFTFMEHPFFFALFWIVALVLWSVFGGAIARLAAVQVARDETISVRQALRFSGGKVLSFLFAPVIPLIVILILGALVAIGALLFYIPYIGPIIVAVFFFLALLAGFVMSLLLIGTIAGWSLMYPTVAVEGSDSFDAISRSFSYVYAKPWRLIWYALVALVYGALTYLFVRLFIWIMLGLSHYFVTWWLTSYRTAQWGIMWPAPSYLSFPYAVNYGALNWGEATAAGILSFWVYLVIGLLGAYLISYYFSASTIMYYLLRRDVDAIEMDDVYMEEQDEEFTEELETQPAVSLEATQVTVVSSESEPTPPVPPATESAESAPTAPPPTGDEPPAS
jgi:hypothetical protein